MDICSFTSHPFRFPSRRKFPPSDILKFIVTILRNKDKEVSLIWVDEGGVLVRSSEFMKRLKNMNIIVQTTGGDASSLNGKEKPKIKNLLI